MIRPTLKEAPSGCLGGEDNGEKRPRIGGRGQGGAELQWGGCGGYAPRRFDRGGSRPGSPEGRGLGRVRVVVGGWGEVADTAVSTEEPGWGSGLQAGQRGPVTSSPSGQPERDGVEAGTCSRSCLQAALSPLPAWQSLSCFLVLMTHPLLTPEHLSSLPPNFSLPLLLIHQKVGTVIHSFIKHELSSPSDLKHSVIIVIPKPPCSALEKGRSRPPSSGESGPRAGEYLGMEYGLCGTIQRAARALVLGPGWPTWLMLEPASQMVPRGGGQVFQGEKKGKGISGRRNSLNNSPGGGKSPRHLGRRVAGEAKERGARMERETS